MSIESYEKGTIKVVWLDENINKIHSKMFESEAEAENYAQPKKDYLIFKLIKQKDMNEFSWEILPYGRYSIYKKLAMKYKKFKLGFLKLLLK